MNRQGRIIRLVALFTMTSFFVFSRGNAEDLEEGISYPYPFEYEEEDSFSDEDEGAAKDDSKKKSSPAWQGYIGKVKVAVDVENTDFLSQCQAKWDSMREKDKPNEEKSSFKDDKKKKDHTPTVSASASIKWED